MERIEETQRRINGIRERFTAALQAVRESSGESEAAIKRWMDHVAPDTEFLLAEVDRLTTTSENRAAVEREWRQRATECKNEADTLREAAVSALCHLTEGPEVVGLRASADNACEVLSEALQATKHPQGTYRLTSIQRAALEARGWTGQDPVAWLLRQNDRNDLGDEG